MRRLFDLWRRAGPVVHSAVPDAELLRRFARFRDGDAFALLLARHGPLVYAACRRMLPDPLDVEDAFQATFLVLVRRIDTLPGRALGPWLHRVAVWTARNLRRRNATRLAVTVRLGETAAPPSAADARLDVDAALATLPGKYRVPVVLCHLHGWTRRELAAHLGCPESTASSLVGRGLAKLRKRLAGRDPAAALAVAVAVPATLSATALRAAVVYAGTFSAAAVSPAVADLTNGVLRMFWAKKLAAAGAAVLVAAAVALGVGLAGDTPPNPPDEKPATERERVERELDAARKRVAELEAKRKELADAANAVPKLVVEIHPPAALRVSEYAAGGKVVGTMETTSVEMLGRFLARTWKDAGGPKKLTLIEYPGCPKDRVKAVLDAVRAGGYEPDWHKVVRPLEDLRPANPMKLPPEAAADAPGRVVVGGFRGIEPFKAEDGTARPAIIVSLDGEGGAHCMYPLAGDAYAYREQPGSPRLNWTDLKAGRTVHLYLAAEPSSNRPVLRVGVVEEAKPADADDPIKNLKPFPPAVRGYFRSIEPDPGTPLRQGITVTGEPGGHTHNPYPLADNVVVVQDLTYYRLNLSDLKPGQAVTLYRAAEPAENAPVVRIRVQFSTAEAKAEPDYVIEPEDVLRVEVAVKPTDPRLPPSAVIVQPITGPDQVRPDGTFSFSLWGLVSVKGLTAEQAVAAIRTHLTTHDRFSKLEIDPDRLLVTVEVLAKFSKRYFVTVEGGDEGEVYSFPVTGDVKVRDAIESVNGLSARLKDTSILLRRKGKPGEPEQRLTVDWADVNRNWYHTTNYPLRPGDRVYVKRKK
jgi:RNA polymerase sigma factor (sigma-70 family)